jgi:hypothetical protein
LRFWRPIHKAKWLRAFDQPALCFHQPPLQAHPRLSFAGVLHALLNFLKYRDVAKSGGFSTRSLATHPYSAAWI